MMQTISILHLLQISSKKNIITYQYGHRKLVNVKEQFFAMKNFTTKPYACPYYIGSADIEMCGVLYACLDRKACYPSGYRRLVCQTNITRPQIIFQPILTVPQYDTIFITVDQADSRLVHTIDQNIFLHPNSSDDRPLFATENLVVIINRGILLTSSTLFNNSHGFHVRIEHGECSMRKFQIYISNDTASSVTQYFTDYTTNRIGAIGCQLNKTE